MHKSDTISLRKDITTMELPGIWKERQEGRGEQGIECIAEFVEIYQKGTSYVQSRES
jgi:hypothetical protein